VPAPLAALLDDVGGVVFLTCPRWGLRHGALARVIGHKVRGAHVELRVLC
jgi:hypothetical protein